MNKEESGSTAAPRAEPEGAIEPPEALAMSQAERAREDEPPADELSRVLLHMPVDVRSVSLAVLAVLGCTFALHWAKEVIIPLLLGVMFSYALTPAVDWLERRHLPRPAASGLLLGSILAVFGWGAWSLSDDASALVDTLPQIAQKLRTTIQRQQTKPVDTIARMEQAAAEIEKVTESAPTASAAASAALDAASGVASGAASGASGAATPAVVRLPASPVVRAAEAAAAAASAAASAAESAASAPGVTRVVVERSRINVRDFLWTGTLGLLTFLGQMAIVVFITFFLLASGNLFRRKMVKLAGPTLSQKKITVQALDEIHEQIQRYLLVQLATSVITGVVTGLAFMAIGLNHAAVWGVLAGLTNLIPYLGAVLIGAASTVLGFLQFGAFDMAFLVGGTSFAIHGIVGNLLTPWLTGRAGSMSPFVVFVAVLTFGWLWGPVGLILGVPIVMVVKSICDRVDELKPIGEFLGA